MRFIDRALLTKAFPHANLSQPPHAPFPDSVKSLLKVELQVDEVVDVLILIVNRYHIPSDSHVVMVVARGRSQPVPKSHGCRTHFLPQVGIKRRTYLKA